MPRMYNHVLTVAAHADDTVVNAGAFLSELLYSEDVEGSSVHDITFFGKRSEKLEEQVNEAGVSRASLGAEHSRALQRLGFKPNNYAFYDFEACSSDFYRRCDTMRDILEDIRGTSEGKQLDVVITHPPWDTHQDHSAVAEEVIRTFKGKCSILFFAFPWNNIVGPKPDVLVAVHHASVIRKKEAIMLYKSQVLPHRRYMEPAIVEAEAMLFGAQCGSQFAEAFHVGQLIL